MHAYLNIKQARENGDIDSLHTIRVLAKDSPLWWHDRGLQYTASGYGKRIPTRHMVRLNGKWRRVYCCIYSNIGTLYIGDLFKKTGEVIIVGDIT